MCGGRILFSKCLHDAILSWYFARDYYKIEDA